MYSHIHRESALLNWVIVILFLLCILLPELNRQLSFIPDAPSTEMRVLAPRPTFNIRNISNFIQQFDSFYNDHFGFRLHLVTINTFLHVKLFGISGVPNVIIGKRGWLFYTRHRPTDPKTLFGWQGYNPYSFDQLKAIQKNLEAEDMWFTKRNITFLILPAPNKHSIYPEYLPWQFNTVIGPSRYVQIFEHMKLYSKLKLIDVREKFMIAKKLHSVDMYYKTDTHWNSIGAFFAYEEIMKRLLTVYPQFVSYRYEDFIEDRKLNLVGDLARMAKLDVSHIFEHQLVPKSNATNNNMGPKKDKILFFGDSFSYLILKNYFYRHFNDVQVNSKLRNALSQLEKDVILKYQPNVVIFEVVEFSWVS